MFNRVTAYLEKPYFFRASGAKGSGITVEIEQKIIRAISKADDTESCDCKRANYRLTGILIDWNYGCYTDSTDIIYYAYAFDAQYYSLKGPNCFFAMWKHY
jgi:hypothetical protein